MFIAYLNISALIGKPRLRLEVSNTFLMGITKTRRTCIKRAIVFAFAVTKRIIKISICE